MNKKNKNKSRTYMLWAAVIIMVSVIGIATLGQISGIFAVFPTLIESTTYSTYVKDVYAIQLFKSGENVGFSLVVKGKAIPSYSKIGNYELRSLNRYGRILERIKFNFDDIIMVDPLPECITDEGIIITNTRKCQPFESMIKLEDTSIILNMKFHSSITEFQLLKNNELLAVRKLVEKPILKQDPFTKLIEQQRIDQTGIIDAEAQRLFETSIKLDSYFGEDLETDSLDIIKIF